MAQVPLNQEEVVIGEVRGHVRLITLNRPRQLNVISPKVVELLAHLLEKWEKEDDAELVIFKGAGRAFSAGGDLKVFYAGKSVEDSCLEVVYRMYWLCYHIHTYKKPMVAFVHGLVMGGGASMVVPLKFSVVTEKTVFAMPEASIALHTDCGFSFILSHLPGHLGEYLALTCARIDGKEMVAAGLATHFIPSEKLHELENRLLSLNSGNETAIRTVIEEFSLSVQPEEGSILNKLPTINKCFSNETVEEIITSFIREGRKQTLPECLKKEFRLTINILRSKISGDLYEGIRALVIDKDNAPKWEPSTLGEVQDEKIDLVFHPFSAELELQIPAEGEACRWDGKYEQSAYPSLKGKH